MSTDRHEPIDKEARDAIQHDLDTTLVVEAAAGTGKTTELVKRNSITQAVAVAEAIHRDAGGEIEEEVAVDVLDDEAVATDRDDRVGAREAGRGPRLVELDVGPCLRPGKLGDDVRDRPVPGDPRRARRQGAPQR
jgi:hypothetical protein